MDADCFFELYARGFSNKNAIECIVGVVEARTSFKEHDRMLIYEIIHIVLRL